MEKLLFMMHSMDLAGTETSLLELLKHLDYTKYQVDLLLVYNHGVLLKQIPKEVKILELPDNEKIFFGRLFSKNRTGSQVYYKYLLYRYMGALQQRIGKLDKTNKGAWDIYKHKIKRMRKSYDCAIAYSAEFKDYIIDKVNASQKICWIHFNYNFIAGNQNTDKKAFYKLDHIVTVSNYCATVLGQYFPELIEKISVIYNIIDVEKIIKKGNRSVKEFGNEDNMFKICTVGRLEEQKNISLSIEAADALKKKGYHFLWYVIGEGSERKKLQEEINNRNLNEYFKLFGKRKNPYAYMQKADIYVQTSKFEGCAIAVAEASALCKPLIVTDIPEFKEQAEDDVTGFIVKAEAGKIADKIEELMIHPEKKKEFSINLQKAGCIHEDSVSRFYELLH